MFSRIAQDTLNSHLAWSPAVAILGPRQIGKTTLARTLLSTHAQAIYLDLEAPQDRARLGEAIGDPPGPVAIARVEQPLGKAGIGRRIPDFCGAGRVTRLLFEG